jgi:hypothetical protein
MHGNEIHRETEGLIDCVRMPPTWEPPEIHSWVCDMEELVESLYVMETPQLVMVTLGSVQCAHRLLVDYR